MRPDEHVRRALADHLQVVSALEPLVPLLCHCADRISERIRSGGKVFWMGNGGSAADAQHFSAELVGRFEAERPGLASIALSTDTSALTAIGNDYGFERIFARQVEALCSAGDVAVGISTSGRSKNVLRAMEAARARGAYTLGLSGHTGGDLVSLCDDCLVVPATVTARIQEAHTVLGHLLCDLVDQAFRA